MFSSLFYITVCVPKLALQNQQWRPSEAMEKRKLQGDLIVAFQYLKGGEGLFSRVCCDRVSEMISN